MSTFKAIKSESCTRGHYIWYLWNSPKARFINFIWNDHSCKILYLLHVLLNILTICLVTKSVIARVSEPIVDCSCIDIGLLMHPYWRACVAASRWRNVRWNRKPLTRYRHSTNIKHKKPLKTVSSDYITVHLKWRMTTNFPHLYEEKTQLGDNCIQNFHLGRYIISYMVGNFVLGRRVSRAVKRNFRPYNN